MFYGKACLYKAIGYLRLGRRKEAAEQAALARKNLFDYTFDRILRDLPISERNLLARLENRDGDGVGLWQEREIAWRYRALGEFPKAARILRELIGRFPKDADLRIDQAEVAAQRGDRAAALQALARARELKPGQGLHRIALTYGSLGEYERAIGILERLSREHPTDAAILKDKGVCELQAGHTKGAIESLEAAAKLDPGLLSAYLTLGSIYIEQRRFDRARNVYDRALSVTPSPGEESLRPLVRESRKNLL